MTDSRNEGVVNEDISWWRHAVMYEVYPRSFADGNGDGDGDLAGLRARLPYLAELGVDGLWIAPWYPSPMADGGYDVSDFLAIHPMFGTLADADALLDEAHAVGLRVIIDMVANHTSDTHPWFDAALRAAPGSPQRARYIIRDGRGEDGELPPNNWISAFGGGAWSRLPAQKERDGQDGQDGQGEHPGQWYLHTFAPEQPDLNWADPDVLEAFDGVLRFWFERGVDGLRIDAAPALAKVAALPDFDYGEDPRFLSNIWLGNPHWDVDAVHDIFRRWRRLADACPGRPIFVAEAVVNGAERLMRYVRPDELHTAFNFPYLQSAWDAGRQRHAIDATLAALAPVGAPSTWVLGSHDEVRPVSRYGRATTSSEHFADGAGEGVDVALGTRRARAAALLMLALPGGAYIYQGDELGLPNVDDLPDEVLQDPVFRRSDGTMRGRDGCRVPMPWSGTAPPFGFSADGVTPWLPQPESWAVLTVQAQDGQEDSTLSVYRKALKLRHEIPALATDAFAWRPSAPGVLDFQRGPVFRCVVNISGEPVELDCDDAADVVLASTDLDGGFLPVDAAVWLLDGGVGGGFRPPRSLERPAQSIAPKERS